MGDALASLLSLQDQTANLCETSVVLLGFKAENWNAPTRA